VPKDNVPKDNVPKDDATKLLARCLRAVILNSFDPKPSSFIEKVDDKELEARMVAVLKNHDHYPVHYLMHLMHGAEIIGYKHPNSCGWVYRHGFQGKHTAIQIG
jgi:hypothetical protein